MTTNLEQIAEWHRTPPEWAEGFTARDWNNAELIAEQLDIAAAGENVDCAKAPAGHYCTLERGHAGACVVFAKP